MPRRDARHFSEIVAQLACTVARLARLVQHAAGLKTPITVNQLFPGLTVRNAPRVGHHKSAARFEKRKEGGITPRWGYTCHQLVAFPDDVWISVNRRRQKRLLIRTHSAVEGLLSG